VHANSFFGVRGIVVLKSLYNDHLWTNIYMHTFYISNNMCCKNSLRSGALYIGFSFTRMFLLALLCLWRNFWTIRAWLLLSTLTHIPYLVPCDLPPFFWNSNWLEGKDISWYQQNWRTVTCCIYRVLNGEH
jgi:hypothetical protein